MAKLASPYLRIGNLVYRRTVAGRSKWKPSNFSSRFDIPESLLDSWDVDEEELMNSRKLETGQKIGIVAWHPVSGELLFGASSKSHADLIDNHGSHLYDEYVRSHTFGRKTLTIHPWHPDRSNFDRVLCFEGQYSFKEVFEYYSDWETDLSECGPF